MTKDRTQESRVRRKAARCGYRVCKSRQRKHVPNLYNHGEYMLINNATRFAALGIQYEATLADIEAFLSQ
jgi:hypothetical protein